MPSFNEARTSACDPIVDIDRLEQSCPMTRYQTLRDSVAILAATPEQQAEYLDQLFVLCTGGGSAAAYLKRLPIDGCARLR